MGVLIVGSSSARSGGQSDSDAADEETWARLGLAPLMATLLLPIIIGVIVLIKCVFNSCCGRRTTTKEEMYGVEGRMTMLAYNDTSFVGTSSYNPHEQSSSPALTLLGTYTPQTLDSIAAFDKVKATKVLINNNNPAVSTVSDFSSSAIESSQPDKSSNIPNADSDLTDTLKRTTGKRQLPDLPQIPQPHHPIRRSSSVLSHDTTSELYATVGEMPNSALKTGIINPYAHLTHRQNSVGDQNSSNKPSTSRNMSTEDEGKNKTKGNSELAPSSDSETYATSSNHPYAKLKRNPSEHPYARVQNSSLLNDEETDTDNYDLPQPYAQSRGRPVGSSSTNNNNQSISNQPSTSSSGSANLDGPVPPRRIGRQWRRGSHPQDNTSHFSGDSQDSRGYTSISVREPLSNIRSQIASTRNTDSHYATVSDDSEEMYAAIDDSEGNYMQIPEGERPTRPSWLERREANSPLPPVPAVPPPETPGMVGDSVTISSAPTSPSLATQQAQNTPPVYAQVTKKTKKGKAPVTPTASNASTSSQYNSGREISEPLPSILMDHTVISVGSSSVSQISGHHSTASSSHHRNKSRTLMDNSNLLEAVLSDNRRWSKADISYSEFEVVREGFSLLESKKSPIMSSSVDRKEKTPVSPRNSVTEELVDEDNYNVIPDKREVDRISRGSKRTRSKDKSHNNNEMLDSDNYQEIDHISNNTYQEIGSGKETDHYQEIGAGSSFAATTNGEIEDDDGPNALYQVIRKKEDDYEDEEEDEFYEKVKPVKDLSKSTLSVSSGHHKDKKHGYEKLKRKGKKSPSPKGKSTSEDDDEEDEEEPHGDGDEMYEQVKYPPYERLKESRSDLAVDNVVEDDDEDETNFYEHIGYSRVKPKHKREQGGKVSPRRSKESEKLEEGLGDISLYAVIDKSKKKNKNTSSSISSSKENNSNNNTLSLSAESNLKSAGFQDSIDKEINTTIQYTPTPSIRSSSLARNVESVSKPRQNLSSLSAGADIEYIDDNIGIEYI